MRLLRRLVLLLIVLPLLGACGSSLPAPPPGYERVDHVADGDTIVVRGDTTVRLVQIDTPEVFFQPECFGEEASKETKTLLPRGTLVRLVADPATEPVDKYGRLLRYVIREDGLNVNLELVAAGYAAPYFFENQRGRYAAELERLALAARRAGLGLWRQCPQTPYEPESGVATGPEG